MQKLTKDQAAIIGAFTGMLAGQLHDLHEYVARIIGRPVWAHEMGNEKTMEQIREAARKDFLSICAD